MLATIWDDISLNCEAIVIIRTKYRTTSLSNILYTIIDDREKRHDILKTNQLKGLYNDIDLIREHSKELIENEKIRTLINSLFKPNEVGSIQPLDLVFLNCYYRRLLRAKLERDFIGKEIRKGLIITGYANYEVDGAIAETLMLLRVICRYLKITTTSATESFPIEKLYMPALWKDISNKLVKLFGEERIIPIEEDDPLPNKGLQAEILHGKQKKIRQSQVLVLLNITFNMWSGSTLVAEGDYVKVIPATYIMRLLPKLQ